MRAAIRAFAFASRKLRSHSLNSLVCRISTIKGVYLKRYRRATQKGKSFPAFPLNAIETARRYASEALIVSVPMQS
jgi:hypothetical protein